MAFVAFDLDETLGRFTSPFYHITLLQPHISYQNDARQQAQQWRIGQPSAELKTKLDAAFAHFVECVASSEEGKKLLRPGILEIIRKLSDAKDAGLVKKIAVYSNNGSLSTLLFATKMIEFLLQKPGIFCDLINFWHPIRFPLNSPNIRNPGRANKTWAVFKKVFSKNCGTSENEITPESSYFFDDTVHPNIYNTLGENNYIVVKPYKRDIGFDILDKCLKEAIESQALQNDQAYWNYIRAIYNDVSTIDKLLYTIRSWNGVYSSTGPRLANQPFTNDTEAILKRLETIFPTPVAQAPASETAPSASPAPPTQNTSSSVNTTTSSQVPFNVGTAPPNTSSVPFFGGKPRKQGRKSKKRSRKVKKTRKGHRKN